MEITTTITTKKRTKLDSSCCMNIPSRLSRKEKNKKNRLKKNSTLIALLDHVLTQRNSTT